MKAISESGLLARFPFTLLGGDVLRRSCPDMGVRSPWGLLGRFPLTLLGGDVLRRSCPDIGVRSPVKPSRNLEALSKLSVADCTDFAVILSFSRPSRYSSSFPSICS